MNNLSWFIYFAGIVDTISVWASFFASVGGIMYLAFMLFISGFVGGFDPKSKEHDEVRGVRREISIIALPILAVCIPIALFVPSRQTLILIAGSELGERAVKSEAVQSVVNPGMDLVKLWIKQETDIITKRMMEQKK